jgi:hypothetical protein
MLPHASYAQIFSSSPYAQTPSAYIPQFVSENVSHPHKTKGIILLYILIFIFLGRKLKEKDSALNDSKNSLTSICSYCLPAFNFDSL